MKYLLGILCFLSLFACARQGVQTVHIVPGNLVLESAKVQEAIHPFFDLASGNTLSLGKTGMFFILSGRTCVGQGTWRQNGDELDLRGQWNRNDKRSACATTIVWKIESGSGNQLVLLTPKGSRFVFRRE
jgi:hypothetical protein